MKYLKYIGIAILVFIGLIFGPALAMGFGGLDALGIIKVKTDDFNTLALISFAIGFVILLIYYAISGPLPEM